MEGLVGQDNWPNNNPSTGQLAADRKVFRQDAGRVHCEDLVRDHLIGRDATRRRDAGSNHRPWLAHRSRRWLRRIFAHTELTPSLETLLVNVTFYGIQICGVLLALGLLGLPVESIVAVASIVFVVPGIAVRESPAYS